MPWGFSNPTATNCTTDTTCNSTVGSGENPLQSPDPLHWRAGGRARRRLPSWLRPRQRRSSARSSTATTARTTDARRGVAGALRALPSVVSPVEHAAPLAPTPSGRPGAPGARGAGRRETSRGPVTSRVSSCPDVPPSAPPRHGGANSAPHGGAHVVAEYARHRGAHIAHCRATVARQASQLPSHRTTARRGRARPSHRRVGRGRRPDRCARGRDTTSGRSRARSARPPHARPPLDRAPVLRGRAVGPARCAALCSRRRASGIASRRPPRDRHGALRPGRCTGLPVSSDTTHRTGGALASSCSTSSPCTPCHPRAPA